MAPYQRRILDALLETNGDRAAAADKLRAKLTSLVGSLGAIRKRTDLTEQERAVLGPRRV